LAVRRCIESGKDGALHDADIFGVHVPDRHIAREPHVRGIRCHGEQQSSSRAYRERDESAYASRLDKGRTVRSTFLPLQGGGQEGDGGTVSGSGHALDPIPTPTLLLKGKERC